MPGLAFPPGTDLLQVLWVPSNQVVSGSDAVQLRWRRSSEVRDLLLAPPEPAYVPAAYCVPVPCVLHPEPVREFPSRHHLDEDLAARLTAWDKQRAKAPYWHDLSVAPGWKAGGWPAHFTFRGPPEPDSDELRCGECGSPVDALLTMTGSEWDASTTSWIPVECGDEAEKPVGLPYRNPRDPTQVEIGRGCTLQMYHCVGTPSHPPRFVMQ
ncbi:hypothetical protein [Streptomyces sp. NPDC088733]|uniref:hypothetical protein n=1 Tax=Streptomyces sp. NPDC088733 TaxID=3365880 RepID=UPI0038024A51